MASGKEECTVKKRIGIHFRLLLMLALVSFEAGANCIATTSTNELLSKIVEKAKRNYKLSKHFGSYQSTQVKKLSKDDKIRQEETKTSRTVWIEDQSYSELIRINDKELTKKEKQEEAKRRTKFLKAIRTQKTENKAYLKELLKYNGQQLYEKYDFRILPPDRDARFILTFEPKRKKLQERSRIEKILNHLSGKIWADEECNLLKVETKLKDTVSFGLGIFAKIENLEVEYTQQKYQQAWLPATLFRRFKARLAVFKNERQEVSTRYYDVFAKPLADGR